jgi:succinoglycan biosynthesis transport protein ExoP
MEDQPFDIRPYLDMLRRQRWLVAGVFAVVLALALAVAAFWPPTYRSSATILIEEQQIPADLVRSTITSFADQRIQVISQRALTRANLADLVERYRLYPRLRPYQTTDEIVDRFRASISIETVTADMARGNGRATIAFKVAFEYEDPEAAQLVVGDLTTLYLDENVKSRQRSTAETSTFLTEESRRYAERVNEIEQQIEAFKTRHAGRLPEQVELNAQMVERTQGEIDRLSRELIALADRRSFIEAQMANFVDGTPLAGPEAANNPAERLRAARTQLAVISSIYSENHPDQVRLRREIEGLEKLVDRSAAGGSSEGLRQLDEARIALARASERYSPDHPDVRELRRRVAALERTVEAGGTGSDGAARAGTAGGTSPGATAGGGALPARGRPDAPRNTALLNMQAQLDSLSSQMRALESERKDLRARLADFERRLTVAPAVEREYVTLTRDHTNALAKYRELQGKVTEAEIAQELERDRKAERFSLIEPALLPEAPIKPNRAVIALMGLILAAGAGLGLGLLRELLDPTVKSVYDAELASAVPILAAIPVLRSSAQIAAGRTRLRYLAAGGVAGVLLLVIAVHFAVIPLGVLWLVMLRRVETLPGFFL